jgi:hypothetical protein
MLSPNKPNYKNLVLVGTTREQVLCGHFDQAGKQVSGCGKAGFHNYFRYEAMNGIQMPVIFCHECSKGLKYKLALKPQ